jgi:hypothetical protein
MFFPPTMLPTNLRMFVDPQKQFGQVPETPPVVVSSPRWAPLRSILSWSRPLSAPAGKPCEESNARITSPLGRPDPCTD